MLSSVWMPMPVMAPAGVSSGSGAPAVRRQRDRGERGLLADHRADVAEPAIVHACLQLGH